MIQKIVIINGNPESGENKLNSFLVETAKKLAENGVLAIQHSLS